MFESVSVEFVSGVIMLIVATAFGVWGANWLHKNRKRWIGTEPVKSDEDRPAAT